MTEELHTELLKKPFMARMGIRAALPDPSQPVDCTYTCFENPFVFSGFQCPREVDFGWAEFLNYADFGKAQFAQLVIFRSATFSKDANFATAIFSDVADERLKQEMERLKKHEDEQTFFAKELRARRVICPMLSTSRLLNFLYESLSDYGQSVTRPFFWLLLLFALGTVLFAVVPVSRGVSHLSLDRAAGLSFANIFSFLQKREMTSYSGPAQVIGALQAVLGLILLFLLGLALRNKFRMK
jgi:hypothetical protein